MSNEKYQYPCGIVDDYPKWMCEVSCCVVGCKDCEYYNGTEYYVKDFKTGLSVWAKHEN